MSNKCICISLYKTLAKCSNLGLPFSSLLLADICVKSVLVSTICVNLVLDFSSVSIA